MPRRKAYKYARSANVAKARSTITIYEIESEKESMLVQDARANFKRHRADERLNLDKARKRKDSEALGDANSDSEVGCGCSNCASNTGKGLTIMTPEVIRFYLKTNKQKQTELEAHGVTISKGDKNKEGYITILESLATRRAFYLTKLGCSGSSCVPTTTPTTMPTVLGSGIPSTPASPPRPRKKRRPPGALSPVHMPSLIPRERDESAFSTPASKGGGLGAAGAADGDAGSHASPRRELPADLLESILGGYLPVDWRKEFRRKQALCLDTLINQVCLDYESYKGIVGPGNALGEEHFKNLQVATFVILTWVLGEMSAYGLQMEVCLREKYSREMSTEGWPYYSGPVIYGGDSTFATVGRCSITCVVHICLYMSGFIAAVHHL
jgi:hypothetical protein